MDGTLNKELIIEKFEQWLLGALDKSLNRESFYCDIHIDMLYKTKTKKEWLYAAFLLHKYLVKMVSEKYPDLEIGICFCLSTAHSSHIPKTFTLRNFSKNMRTPPELMIYNKTERNALLENGIFLSEISAKYKMDAYYYEEKEDVIWRWIYFI